MTLEELMAQPERQGKICGYIGDRPVYHGDKLVAIENGWRILIKTCNQKGIILAFYSFDYTNDAIEDGLITTRIPGFENYQSPEDDHPIRSRDVAFAKPPIESDPEYEGLFI